MAVLRDAAGESGLVSDGDWILLEDMDLRGTVAVIQLKHVGVGEFLDKPFTYITEDTFKRLGCTEVLPGDVLISRMADPIGRACVAPQVSFRCVTAVDITILRVDPGIASPSYVRHLCNSPLMREQIERASRGTTRARITRTELEALEVPLPPLAEQRRIAGILDRADRVRRMRRYAQQMSAAFLQAVFVRMFGDVRTDAHGWGLRIIDDVVAFSQYGTSKKSNTEGKGYPVLGMGNITYEGGIDVSSLAYVELSDLEFRELRLNQGDIIFNRTNSTELVGKTARWNLAMDAVIASYLVRLRLTNDVLPEYFVALLNGRYFKRLFQERCKKAVGQSNISPTLLREFPAMIPPLALQEQFARIVQQFERLRAQQREAERQAEQLFQALLQRAFSGGL